MSSKDDIAYWFSLPNGVHVPVMKGESKAKAVGRFIKDKQKARRDKRIDEHFDVMDKAAHDWSKLERKYNPNISDENLYMKSLDKGYELANSHMENKYGKNWDKYSKHSIKGRAKTKEEKLDELSDKAGDWEMMKDEARQRGSYENYKTAKAKFERYDRQYEREKARPTAKYKLSEAKRILKRGGDTAEMRRARQYYEKKLKFAESLDPDDFDSKADYSRTSSKAWDAVDYAFKQYEDATTFKSKSGSLRNRKRRK